MLSSYNGACACFQFLLGIGFPPWGLFPEENYFFLLSDFSSHTFVVVALFIWFGVVYFCSGFDS